MPFKVVFTDYDYESINIEKDTLAAIDCEIVELQSKDENTLIQGCKDADALVVQFAPITSKVIEALSNCKVISRYGIGVDNIDVNVCSRKGIPVVNVPGFCLKEVANHALALILSIGRRIVPLVNSVKDGKWDTFGVGKPIVDFSELTLGLVGFGQIPRNLYHKVKYLFKEILIFDPYINESTLKDYEVKSVSFYDFLRKSDYISIHCPYTEETHHLFDERQFQLMKHTAFVINTSRGKIINSEALYSALQNGQISGAALDVLEKEPPDFEFRLAKLDNVIITPHISFYSESSLRFLKHNTALNVVKVLSGEKPLNIVNSSALQVN